MAFVKTYSIPDSRIPELVEVFSDGYEEGQGQTQAQYASQKFDAEIIMYVRRRVLDYRRAQAKASVDQTFEVNSV